MSIRIISGKLKGRRIATVDGTSTRPTADMVREAVFSMIGHDIKNAFFLELFAGTGAMGIEAASRGAKKIVFVENARQAVDVIKKNLEDCGISGSAGIIKWDIEKNLKCLGSFDECFDIVFLDPPYEKSMVKKALDNLAESRALKNGASVIVQHSKNEPVDLSGLENIFSVEKNRHYGKNMVTFLIFKSQDIPAA